MAQLPLGPEMVEEHFYAEYIMEMLRCVQDQYHVTVQQLSQALKQTNYSFPGASIFAVNISRWFGADPFRFSFMISQI